MRVIQPICRTALTPSDIRFIVSTLQPAGQNQEHLLRLLADEGTRDVILDEDAVFHALLESPAQVEVSLPFYFYVLVRNVLKAAGLDDRLVADYVAAVLAHFSEEFSRQKGVTRRGAFLYVVDVLEEIEKAPAEEKFFLITNLGNNTLVLTSIFKDHIEYRARRRGAPGVDYYEAMGRAQFDVASRHRLASEFNLDRVFSTVARSFGGIRQTLEEMRERMLFLG